MGITAMFVTAFMRNWKTLLVFYCFLALFLGLGVYDSANMLATPIRGLTSNYELKIAENAQENEVRTMPKTNHLIPTYEESIVQSLTLAKEFEQRDDTTDADFNYQLGLSRMLGLFRQVPDHRNQDCRAMHYDLDQLALTPISVIIPVHQEHWTVLLRTVNSIGTTQASSTNPYNFDHINDLYF